VTRHTKTHDVATMRLGKNGRAGEIRTHDLLHPMQARYQATLQPEGSSEGSRSPMPRPYASPFPPKSPGRIQPLIPPIHPDRVHHRTHGIHRNGPLQDELPIRWILCFPCVLWCQGLRSLLALHEFRDQHRIGCSRQKVWRPRRDSNTRPSV
jgi:hypothetical protein